MRFGLAMMMLLGWCASVAAVPLPPALHELDTALAQAENNLAGLNHRIAANQREHQAAMGTLQGTTQTLLQLAQWPQPLVQLHSLARSPIPAGTLLRITQTNLLQRQQALATRLHDDLELRQQAHAQLASLNDLRAQMAGQRKRLSLSEQQSLRLAALDAGTLATRLSQPSAGLAALAPAPAATNHALHPVQGQQLPAGDDGVFYVTQPQAPVVAVLAGTVDYAGPFQNLGGLVITRSAGNVYGVYAGLGSLTVNEGQQLDVGSPLGAMPHNHPRLYFEIRRNGKPLALESLRK